MFRPLVLVGIASLSILLASCSMNSSPNSAALDLRGDALLFSQTGQFWTADELEHIWDTQGFQASPAGQQPAQAFVPLFFDDNGRLLTADEYNGIVERNEVIDDSNVYLTDLQTYKKVLQGSQTLQTASVKLDYIDEKYVLGMPLKASDGLATTAVGPVETVYAFDPYQTHYQTQAEVEAEVAEKMAEVGALQMMANPSVNVTDIPYSNQSENPDNFYNGHNGIVTALNNGGLTGGSRLSRATRTMEARGKAKSSGNDVNSRADEVSEIAITNSFEKGRQALLRSRAYVTPL